MFKRALVVGLVLLAVAALIWGNRIAAASVDAKLPDILSSELGLEVTLAPVSANLLTLGVSSPQLRLGSSAQPAVTATEVEVHLSWRSLLRGEIRLSSATANTVRLDLAQWPDSEDDNSDYQFLDPWLPTGLKVKTLEYQLADAERLTLRALSWRRLIDGSSTLDVRYSTAGKRIALETSVASLQDLLSLQELNLTGSIRVLQTRGSRVDFNLQIAAAEKLAYSARLAAQSAAMNATVEFSSAKAWSLPTDSRTSIESIALAPLATLVETYTPDETQSGGKDLKQALPKLQLPEHKGSIHIGEIVGDTRAFENLDLAFISSEKAITIPSLTGNGSHGNLTATAELVMDNNQWQVNADANLVTRDETSGIATDYLGNDWFWRSGKAQLGSSGSSWGELLYSTSGSIALQGFHAGPAKTPIVLNATITGAETELFFNDIRVTAGDGSLTGSARLRRVPAESRPELELDITSRQLSLEFLDPGEDISDRAGIPVPHYLAAFPGLSLKVKAELEELRLPGFDMQRLQVDWRRDPAGNTLSATAYDHFQGSAVLDLTAKSLANKTAQVDMRLLLKRVDLRRAFTGSGSLLNERFSGTLDLESTGATVEEIFTAMRGTAALNLETRRDNDWQRPSNDNETLAFSGDASLVVRNGYILGSQIEKLKIENLNQDLSGNLSIEAGRVPWLVANLESRRLNITRLLDAIPDEGEPSEQQDALELVKAAGALQISLRAESMLWQQMPLENVLIEVSSGGEQFAINHFDFQLHGGSVASQGSISWQTDSADFSATAQVSQVDLDQFVLPKGQHQVNPMSGSINLASNGRQLDELIGAMTGSVVLDNSNKPAANTNNRRRLDIEIAKLSQGVSAKINALEWGDSSLRGVARFFNTERPRWEIEITGGTVSLLPWENNSTSEPQAVSPKSKKESKSKNTDKGKDKQVDVPSIVENTATASANAVQRVLSAPARWLAGESGTSTKGDKYFNDQPFDLSLVQRYDIDLDGTIESLESSQFIARQVAVSAQADKGQLRLGASSADLNGGSAELSMQYDALNPPHAGELTTTVRNVYGTLDRHGSPNSAFLQLKSQGLSEAALAASLNGLAYFEVGKGPMDDRAAPLLSSDLTLSIVRTLIPTASKRQPELQCAITLANFKDGIGVTPYGYAAQTRSANLIGRLELDLAKERLTLKFDSRSREGVGLSLSSVFANTIQIRGPLTNPSIVPDTTSLLWRGWAAFMTGGLSVVGESVLKRTLSSANPCEDIRKSIRKDICSTDSPEARSNLLCPTT